MQITDKLIRSVTETAYLTAENVKRYRTMLRYFFLEYERIHYWLDQDEVWQELKSHQEFADYTMDQCKQDLDALVNWKNLIEIQDTKRVATVEEFKNRKYRYQLSEYGVEIERMTVRLEHLSVEGASLEPTLLERLEKEIRQLLFVSKQSPAKVYTWWKDLSNDFKRLNQNYQDYMRELNSVKAEEMMKTTEFLVYKDRLIEYLRSFIKGLHLHASAIEEEMKQMKIETVELVFSKVIEYEKSIPHIDTVIDEKQIAENLRGSWRSIVSWFVGENGRESEASRLFDMTNESIRKITRYATQISEQFTMGANRKEEYKKLSVMFQKCQNIAEAHKLSAVVFGVEAPLHLKGNLIRQTDSVNSGVYEEQPLEIQIKPRIRAYGEKQPRSVIQDHSLQKEMARQESIQKINREKQLVDSYIIDGTVCFSKLGCVEPQVRNILLRWMSKALEHKNHKAKTEDGREFFIENPQEKEICMVQCTDGVFEMPAFVLKFEDKK